MTDFGTVALTSAAILLVVQAVTFGIGRRIGRYNVVDVAWGAGLAAVAVAAPVVGAGDSVRPGLLAVIVAIWGLRLSWHMWRKSAGAGEDPRYTAMLDRRGGNRTSTVITRIFLTQAVAQWVISLPIQVSAVGRPVTGIGWWLVGAGAVVAVAGIVVEAVGDAQLRRFKADPANRGTINDRGLWGWSRHPNYFGDACVWWGVFVVASAQWPGVLTVVSPLAMTYFLVYATGARLLEEHLAERPGYADYQRRTSYFVPWPPKV